MEDQDDQIKVKKPVAFVTNCSDEYYHSMGCDKLVKSAKYFHPEIPFFVFGSEEVEAIDRPQNLLMPFILNKLIDDYEMVVRFDADSMITGPLDELLSATDYDIIGVRNNNDYAKAGKDEPLSQYGVNTFEYLNAGLVGTTSKSFVGDWMNCNVMFGMMCPFQEQSVLNAIAPKFKTLVVDGIDTEVYYGVSCLSGTETHWDSWKDIHVVKGELYLGSKKVKVLHHAGGFNPNKLGFYMFNNQTRKRLTEIITQ